jgi:hypothetical protein
VETALQQAKEVSFTKEVNNYPFLIVRALDPNTCRNVNAELQAADHSNVLAIFSGEPAISDRRRVLFYAFNYKTEHTEGTRR